MSRNSLNRSEMGRTELNHRHRRAELDVLGWARSGRPTQIDRHTILLAAGAPSQLVNALRIEIIFAGFRNL